MDPQSTPIQNNNEVQSPTGIPFQPSVPGPSSPQQSLLEKYPWSKWIILLLIILVLIALGSNTIQNASDKKTVSQISPTAKTEKPQPTQKPSIKESTSAYYFKNTNFGYKITYPKGWVSDNQESFGKVSKQQTFHPDVDILAQDTPYFSVNVTDNAQEADPTMDEEFSLEQYFNNLYAQPNGPLRTLATGDENKIGNETVDGRKAVLLEKTINSGENKLYFKTVIVYAKPYIYELTASQSGGDGSIEPFTGQFEAFYKSMTFTK